MTFSLRHIILLIGIVTIYISFLFFGRDTDTYDILIIAGLIISTISFLFILFKKEKLKSKILWTLIIIGCIVLLQLTESMFIKISYGIFVKGNISRLTKLNSILLAKNNGDILFIPHSDKAVLVKFTDQEINEIQHLLLGTKISLVEKDSQKVFYRTFGMLDVSHGVYYFYGKEKPSKKFKNILGNWYY